MIGIYKISSLIKPNRIYIGSALNIKRRWNKHKSDLKNNKHHSIKLQRHYNKYGIDDLIFEIIEECVIDCLIDWEQHYIDKTHTYFNTCKIAGSSKGRIPWNKGLSTVQKNIENLGNN